MHLPAFMRQALGLGLLLTLVVLALSACAGGGGSAQEEARHNGGIAFMQQDSDGFWQTWVANVDLSHRVKLTGEAANSGWAVWKPGGERLAFDSDRADPDPTDPEAISDIFTMKPDGSGVAKLTDSEGLSSDAGWSSDD